MIDVLERIDYFANNTPNKIAFKSVCGEITYSQLWEAAKKLSKLIQNLQAEGKLKPKAPIAVYGHKEPQMLVAFAGCALARHPYCPLDRSMPETRIDDILRTINTPFWIKCEEAEARILELNVSNLGESDEYQAEYQVDKENQTDDKYQVYKKNEVYDEYQADKEYEAGEAHEIDSSEINEIEPSDVAYIIFTSGSTGKPKGVEVTRENLGNFLEWMTGAGSSIDDKEGKVFLNQAPYSFDLSVMDTYTALVCGGTIASLDKGTMATPADTMEFLKNQQVNYWVSTPSFADMILAEKTFNAQNYPDIKVFFFCGERLTKTTANKLIEAFPNAKVINTYGPTESTVAISSVEICSEHIDSQDELPVGVVKFGTKVFIHREGDTIQDLLNENIVNEKIYNQKVEEGLKPKDVLASQEVDEGFKGKDALASQEVDEGLKQKDALASQEMEEGFKQNDALASQEVEEGLKPKDAFASQELEKGFIGKDTMVTQEPEIGEILIEGNTVAKGYFKMPEKTAIAFEVVKMKNGQLRRLYHTGDLGYFKNGMLYCVGRTDLQVKVHGYRMELGDIEANILLKEEVEAVCVVPKRKDGKIRSLVAYVVSPSACGTFEDAKSIKQHLRGLLPEYMIPKKIKFIDRLPMTSNGKVNRKALEEVT